MWIDYRQPRDNISSYISARLKKNAAESPHRLCNLHGEYSASDNPKRKLCEKFWEPGIDLHDEGFGGKMTLPLVTFGYFERAGTAVGNVHG